MTRRRTERGFTLIEVMMALAILTVGAVGILSLQQAATRGNSEARQMTLATEVNRAWLERIRRDSLMWTGTAAGSRAATQYLVRLPANGTTDWFVPVPAAPTESYGFDWFGRDTRDNTAIRYCTQARLTWLVPEINANSAPPSVQVDVRTWFHRRGYARDNIQSDLSLFDNCSLGSPADVDAEIRAANSRIKSVTGTLVLRPVPPR
ncbi:MAG: prepilin-type N-terminal cleavage/methylation domain-containing protein [Burkholderiaceae bacterium]|nr:prepilin-type N-terminal cleavage/methylation domain-containing protein [Burkholderiaceae bacterium]